MGRTGKFCKLATVSWFLTLKNGEIEAKERYTFSKSGKGRQLKSFYLFHFYGKGDRKSVV